MSSNYIADDGYNEKFYVAPEPGIHGSIRGTFRPASKPARSKHTQRCEKLTDEEADKATAEEVAPRILTWSEVDKDGQPRPITPETVLGIKPALFQILTGMVMGYVPTIIRTEVQPGEITVDEAWKDGWHASALLLKFISREGRGLT